MDNLPTDFRAKYEELRITNDPILNKPISDCLGDPDRLWTLPSGCRMFRFDNGYISAYDHTGRYPIICFYGEIYRWHRTLGGPSNTPFGRPLTDMRLLPDGSQCVVFEGGHIHQWGKKVQSFPAAKCTASYQPPPPAFPFGIGPNKTPVPFLQKWIEVSLQRDPLSNYSIIEELGPIDSGLRNIDAGGQRMAFDGGWMVGFDNIICVVYGPIHKLWARTGRVTGGWGRPLVDEQDLEDGGRCQVFEGGHIHRYGDDARPFPMEQCTARYKPFPREGVRWNVMPPHYQRKWSQLAVVTNPLSQESIAVGLGALTGGPRDFAAPKAGQYVLFDNGLLASPPGDPTSYPPNTPLELTPPFACYGKIYSFWENAGSSKSKYGRPLSDEQSLPDGGRCCIFEGGHIHYNVGQARDFPPNECTATYQARSNPAPAPPPRPSPPKIAQPLPPSSPAFSGTLVAEYPQTFSPAASTYPQSPQSYPGPAQTYSEFESYSAPAQTHPDYQSYSASAHSAPAQTYPESQPYSAPAQTYPLQTYSQPSQTYSDMSQTYPSQPYSRPQGYPSPTYSHSTQPIPQPEMGYQQPQPQYNSGGYSGGNTRPPASAPLGGMSSIAKPVGCIAMLIFTWLGLNIEGDDCACSCCNC